MPGPVARRLLGMLDRRVAWRGPAEAGTVYLTFDDGPEPEVTPWVLDTLGAHGAKATFFCLGRHAASHPQLVQRIRDEGHAVGHHTWDHADGWRTPGRAYLRSVLLGAEALGSPLFRPPYGRLPCRSKALRQRFQVVMWDVRGGDYRPGRPGAACARHVLRRARPGSIILLHDNRKSSACLRDALPLILEGLARAGLRCASLPPALTSR